MKYSFCPNCKSNLEETENYFECKSCGMIVYKNSAPTASAVIINGNKVLLSTRAINPKKGCYDLVGGFLSNGESPRDGVLREIIEETGLSVEIIDLLGVYMDDYMFQGIELNTLNFYYVTKIIDGEMKPDDDVETLEWFDIDKVPLEKLAFKSQKQVIRDLKTWLMKNKNQA